MQPTLPTTKSLEKLPSTRYALEAVASVIRGDVLDFGSGKSHYRPILKKHARKITTMDIQPDPSVDVVGDVLHPPFPDESFDTVVSSHVMEHVRRPWLMAVQIHRLLRPGGHAVVISPFMYIEHRDPTDYFRFTVDGMRSLFEDIGMEVLLCARIGGWFRIMSEVMRHKFLNPYRKLPWWKRRCVSLLTCLSHALNRLCPPGRTYAGVLLIARKPPKK